MNALTTVSELRKPPQQAQAPDQAIDMFTERGFVLAQRIASAYASADAVPAAFRLQVLKKSRDGDVWVENPSAIGNCLVAIETARAVGMSITAVMQNANVIEGRLSWSAQFVIAAINASGRFHPLRFDIKKRGPITAKYREKQGWNKAKGGFDFVDVEVNIEDEVCIAWTLPKGAPIPASIYTLDQARAANLPVIESAPVSLKLAVEEGWYGKSGSKWQTEMKALMLQYRAGAFFGRIHAPDIVMGMGRTSEELADVVDVRSDGTYTVTTETLRDGMRHVDSDGVLTHSPSTTLSQAGLSTGQEQREYSTVGAGQAPSEPAAGQAGQAKPAQTNQQATPAFDLDAFAERLEKCTSEDTLDVMADEISGLQRDQVISDDAAATLLNIFRRRKGELQSGASQQQANSPAGAPAGGGRRRSAAASNPQQSLD
ncbi:MAG: hypothetical protein WAQ08_15880 [Aquabacterium sp.]|uniref:hypothetical protein n=1 Tax=Aquabacterium sp. TaxID=1872578 RepID=UPI003BB0BAA4